MLPLVRQGFAGVGARGGRRTDGGWSLRAVRSRAGALERGFKNTAKILILLHEIFQAVSVVKHDVEAAHILVAKFTTADAKEICPCQQTHKFPAIDDRQMMDARLFKQLAN